MAPTKRDIKTRFFEKIVRSAETDCWLWQGGSHLYGRLWVGGKDMLAHRLSFTLFNGEIPSDKCVCHRCDTPRCVNPDHLFLGDLTENHADMMRKLRQARGKNHGARLHPDRLARGENHGRARLTELQVQGIRHLLSLGTPRQQVATHYKISYQHVVRIEKGKSWQAQQ